MNPVCPDAVLPWVALDEVSIRLRYVFFKYSLLESDGVLMECPSGIAYGNLLISELNRGLPQWESHRDPISR